MIKLLLLYQFRVVNAFIFSYLSLSYAEYLPHNLKIQAAFLK